MIIHYLTVDGEVFLFESEADRDAEATKMCLEFDPECGLDAHPPGNGDWFKKFLAVQDDMSNEHPSVNISIGHTELL